MLNDEPELFEESDEEEKHKNPEDRKRLFRRELASMLYGFGDKKVSKHLIILDNTSCNIEYSFIFSGAQGRYTRSVGENRSLLHRAVMSKSFECRKAQSNRPRRYLLFNKT